MTRTVLGIIGGSGVYDIPGLENRALGAVKSPWGEPSDALLFGRFKGVDLVFLPRHGRGHVQTPSSINYRANIDALKRVGVTDVISVSACGSLKEESAAGHVRDRRPVHRPHLRAREELLRPRLRGACLDGASGRSAHRRMRWYEACAEEGMPHAQRRHLSLHGRSAVLVAVRNSISTDRGAARVIGMTAMPEAKLAREAELPYAHRRDGDGLRLLAPRSRPRDGRSGGEDHARTPTMRATPGGNVAPSSVRSTCRRRWSDVLDTAVITAPEKRDPA